MTPLSHLRPLKAMTATPRSTAFWPAQQREQLTDLSPVAQGAAQRQLGPDLVAVAAAVALAHDVAGLDQLGEDPVGGALGDADRGRDVAQARARVVGHADQHVGVVGEEGPARGRLLRAFLHNSRKVCHESLITCVHGYEAHPDSSSVADPGRIADPGRFTDPAPFNRARGIPTTGGKKMTTPTVKEPVGGYDSLKTKEVIASLSSHSQVELARIESYERAHRNRKAVFSKLRRLRQDEPLPGPDALSTEEVVAALRRFQAGRVTLVSRDAKR